ncbi:hypothetical protein [Streptomyces mirabilis]|uniref:hypothetical protein n=1 Tax=Streptomyces mirabilis TaxID=68239 RepID=UPI003646F22E
MLSRSAQAIVRFIYAELEAFATGGGENVDTEGSEELLRNLSAVLPRHNRATSPEA